MKRGSERTAPRNSPAFTVWMKLLFLGEVCRETKFEFFFFLVWFGSKSCSKNSRIASKKIVVYLGLCIVCLVIGKL